MEMESLYVRSTRAPRAIRVVEPKVSRIVCLRAAKGSTSSMSILQVVQAGRVEKFGEEKSSCEVQPGRSLNQWSLETPVR